MTDPNGPPPQRATLLIGYGTFGLDVLRRLLASTAARGVLVWEEPRGGADNSARRLQDLELLWVQDRFDHQGRQVDIESIHEGSSIEMMYDLYRQIREVNPSSAAEQGLAQAMEAAAKTLLSAASRSARDQPLPLGLDVIVLARPTGPEVIGRLNHMLQGGIERLSNYVNLERAVSGTEVLNFLQILDFENYWDRSNRGLRIRETLASAVRMWQHRREQDQPSFGRIYLVDGTTADGIRDERQRVDEVGLFLELLLFEGQRSGELQHLYQASGPNESPIATFGVRLVERSAGLLSRLAAAYFGIGWLDYLVDGGVSGSNPLPTALRRSLEPYHPKALDGLLNGDKLRTVLRQSLEALEQTLAALPADNADWPQRVRDLYTERVRDLEAELAGRVHARMKEIGQQQLDGLGETLCEAIEEDLHQSRLQVPLKEIIHEVEATLANLQTMPSAVRSEAVDTEPVLNSVADLHHRYRQFREQQLRPSATRFWWPLFAVVLSAGLSPVASDVLQDIPGPSPPTGFLLSAAYEVSQWLANPVVMGGLLLLGFWGLGRFALESRLRGRVQRAVDFWKHSERGRLISRLRGELQPGGSLSRPLEQLQERLIHQMAVSIRGEVSRELARVATRLQERRREIRWLRGQLSEFLTMHGMTVEERFNERTLLERESTGIRHSMERSEDFDRMLRSNEPIPERFASITAERKPFAGWEQRYSDAFLYALSFIDELSRIYKDPLLQELSRPGTGPEQLARARELHQFLDRYGKFDLAFSWKAGEGVPVVRHYCLMPDTWFSLQGIPQALADLRIVEQNVIHGSDVARAYILRIQVGVESACLLGGG